MLIGAKRAPRPSEDRPADLGKPHGRHDCVIGHGRWLAQLGPLRYNATHSGAEVSMASTTMVHIRLDESVKAQATETLAAMGLSVSDAVRVFLMRVVAEKQLPFALKVPNAESRAAMDEADLIVRTRRARFRKAADLFNDLEKNRGQ
jgi:DNA-damage-inducible protein J